jgi:hypothetical protein
MFFVRSSGDQVALPATLHQHGIRQVMYLFYVIDNIFLGNKRNPGYNSMLFSAEFNQGRKTVYKVVTKHKVTHR